jgi:hypothetical protein
MAQFYIYFVKNFVVTMAPITKLTKKTKRSAKGLGVDETKIY